MNDMTHFFLSQLLTASPALVAYLGIIIAALMYWSRHPRPSMLAFIAGLLLFLSTVGQMLFTAYMVQSRMSSGGTVQATAAMMGVVSIATSIIRAGGIVLLTWAVFAGRADDVPVASRFETLPPR